MKNLIKTMINKSKKLFESHSNVLVAVSTGVDSMVLLKFLYDNKERLNISNIGVAHINHKQRKQSDEEERFLIDYCNELKIPLYISHFNGQFTEANARKFRYNFFEEIMLENNYTALVTAHHKDDQVETIFMKIIRGNRLFDCAGIKEKQSFANGELIRPFIDLEKSYLYDSFWNVLHYEDESNKSDKYFRNRVRNNYIPTLENENPKIKESFVELGKSITDLHKCLKELIYNVDYLNLSVFKKYSKELQLHFIQFYLEENPNIILNKTLVENLVNILNKNLNKEFYCHKLTDKIHLSITKNHWKLVHN